MNNSKQTIYEIRIVWKFEKKSKKIIEKNNRKKQLNNSKW